MDFSEPIFVYGIGVLLPPRRQKLRMSEWLRSKPKGLLHMDHILPGLCWTSRMLTLFQNDAKGQIIAKEENY